MEDLKKADISSHSPFLILLLSLTFLSLYVNQAPHNLLISLLFIVITTLTVLKSNNNKRLSNHFKDHILFYGALVLYLVLYAFINIYHLGFGQELAYAMKRSRWIPFCFILAPALPILVLQNKKNEGLFLNVAVYGLSLLSLLIIYDSFTRFIWTEPSTSLWFKSSMDNSLSPRASWTYNAIPFSKMAVFASGFLLLSSQFLNQQKRYVEGRLSQVLSFLMFIVAIFTLTRATWLGLFLCTPLVIIYLKNTKVLILSLLALSLLASFITFSPRFSERLSSITSTKSYSNTYRLEHWKANLKVIADHPLIGIGYAQNRLETKMKPYMHEFHVDAHRVYGKHPHNEYLDIASGMGLISLLLFIWIIAYPILNKVRTVGFHQLTSIEFSASVFLLYIFSTAFFDKITLTSWSMILFCWAVLLYSPNKQTIPKPQA